MKSKKDKIFISTGSTLLDLCVGGGVGMGFPVGKVVNIVGDKSVGKSGLACELIATAKYNFQDRLRFVYDDAEMGLTFDTKNLYGIDIDEHRIQSETVEEFFCNYMDFLKSVGEDEVGIYVLDTLDGLSSLELKKRGEERIKAHRQGKDFDKGSYQMSSAKFLSQEFFRNITGETDKKNTLLVIISQVRDNIDPFSFTKYVRSGGKALDFYAHTVLWLSVLKKIQRLGRAVGVLIKARTSKSKTPRPFRDCKFLFYFDYGIDDVGGNVDYLFDFRTEKGELKKNAVAQWDEGGMKETKAEILQFLKDNQVEVSGESTKAKMLDLIEADPELLELYNERRGLVLSRKEMIAWIEVEMKEEELKRRVIEKWEDREKEISTKRKPKF